MVQGAENILSYTAWRPRDWWLRVAPEIVSDRSHLPVFFNFCKFRRNPDESEGNWCAIHRCDAPFLQRQQCDKVEKGLSGIVSPPSRTYSPNCCFGTQSSVQQSGIGILDANSATFIRSLGNFHDPFVVRISSVTNRSRYIEISKANVILLISPLKSLFSPTTKSSDPTSPTHLHLVRPTIIGRNAWGGCQIGRPE